ncbi:MAG: hypothetical protein ACR2NP_21060 [Pirellulaceae bacterium]
MIKNIVAVVAGYLFWTVIFLGGGAGIRSLRPAVHDENGLTTDTSTLVIYLAISIVASLTAGFVCAKLAEYKSWKFVTILAVLLLATGIPVQLSAGAALPVWYNAAFLLLLVPVTLIGGLSGGLKLDAGRSRKTGQEESSKAG